MLLRVWNTLEAPRTWSGLNQHLGKIEKDNRIPQRYKRKATRSDVPAKLCIMQRHTRPKPEAPHGSI